MPFGREECVSTLVEAQRSGREDEMGAGWSLSLFLFFLVYATKQENKQAQKGERVERYFVGMQF